MTGSTWFMSGVKGYSFMTFILFVGQSLKTIALCLLGWCCAFRLICFTLIWVLVAFISFFTLTGWYSAKHTGWMPVFWYRLLIELKEFSETSLNGGWILCIMRRSGLDRFSRSIIAVGFCVTRSSYVLLGMRREKLYVKFEIIVILRYLQRKFL